jgi:hypothetical protein
MRTPREANVGSEGTPHVLYSFAAPVTINVVLVAQHTHLTKADEEDVARCGLQAGPMPLLEEPSTCAKKPSASRRVWRYVKSIGSLNPVVELVRTLVDIVRGVL